MIRYNDVAVSQADRRDMCTVYIISLDDKLHHDQVLGL